MELLEKICDAIIIVLAKYHENINAGDLLFNQRPFFKLILNLIYDIQRQEYQFQRQEVEGMFLQLTKMFEKIEPLNFPGFSFVWLELISNKYYLPALLNKREHWESYHVLIVKLLEFFKFYTTHETINYDFMRTFYKGVLRVLLMFLHDYNDFLSEYAYVFIEVIPSHLIQIRNIILSAYPKDIYQREPFTITNIDQVEDFKKMPSFQYPDLKEKIQINGFEENLELFLKGQDPQLNGIKKRLKETFEMDSNSSVINILTLAVPYLLYTKSYVDQRDNCLKFFQILIK